MVCSGEVPEVDATWDNHMATATLPPQQPTPVADGQRLLLRGVDWATYRKISEALTGRHVRLSYDRGNLEFMTISTIHAVLSRLLFQLVVVLTEELGMPRRSCGDMTCDRDDLERGLEPDECFYLINEPLIRNKEQIDLATDPPPDLGIEVDIARSSRNRLSIYAALRVPEVWRFDGERLVIHQLQTEGRYIEVQRSCYFPFLSGADVVRFLQQRTQTDENALIRSFRAWVREQVAPGQP